MRIKKFSMMLLTAMSLAALLNGCGSSSKEGSATTAALDAVPKVSEGFCAQCHSPDIDHVAGTKIYDAYLATKHFASGEVGCQDCHGGGAEHNGVGPMPYPNPDAGGKCYTCHKDYLKYVTGHFFNYTAAAGNKGRPAVYVSSNYQKSCTSCHDPHLAENGVRNGELSTVTTGSLVAGTAKGTEHKDWAETPGGHGDVTGPAFGEDFKLDDDCNRCHTTTGFINYANSAYTSAPAWGTATDKTKEVITCAACHTDYNFKNRVRKTGQVTAPYGDNGLYPQQFPDVGATNLCIACHTGRKNMDYINDIPDFSNVSMASPHYLPAAGMMYMKIGFTGFTSANTAIAGASATQNTYGKSLSPDSASTPGGLVGAGVTSTHRKLGTPAIIGDHGITAGNYDSDGPCVTCHLNGSGQADRKSSHTLSAINANTYVQLCIKCHAQEGSAAGMQLVAANGSDFVAKFVEPNSTAYQTALTLAGKVLEANWNIRFKNGSFYDLTKDATGKTPVKDWTRKQAGATAPAGVTLPLTAAQAKKLFGACFNLKLLYNEKGAFAHARSYTRRLVYDSIDFIDDGKINMSVSATAIATTPADYGKGATAYTDATLGTFGAGTTEGMLFLNNWDRNTGFWKPTERP